MMSCWISEVLNRSVCWMRIVLVVDGGCKNATGMNTVGWYVYGCGCVWLVELIIDDVGESLIIDAAAVVCFHGTLKLLKLLENGKSA